jgi:hypothetical protein
MSDETVASLGFAVDSSGLKSGGADLDTFKDKARAVEDQANKTNDALSKVGKPATDLSTSLKGVTTDAVAFSAAQQKVVDSLDQQIVKTQLTSAEMRVFQALQQSGTTLETDAGRAIAQRALALDQALTSTKASTVGNSALGAALQAIFPAMTTTATAAGAVAAAHKSANQATTELVESMRGLYPVVNQLGGSMGQLHGFLLASRDGLVAFAAIAGGVALLEMAKIGDAAETARKNFVALTGSTDLGNASFLKVKDTAKQTGIEFTTLETAIEAASQGMNKGEWNPPILVNAASSVAKFNDGLDTLFGTLGKVLQSSNATGEQEQKIFAALGNDIGKTGTITEATFQTIMQNSLPLARAIANAFGFSSLVEFNNQLAKTPIPLKQLEDQINKIKPAVDANFDPAKVNTVEQATRALSGAWKDLLEELAKDGAFQFVITELANVSRSIKDTIQEIQDLIAWFAKIPTGALQGAAGGIAAGAAVGGVIGGPTGALVGGAIGGAAGAAIGGADGNTINAAGGAGGTEGLSMGPNFMQPSGDAGTLNLGDLGGGSGGATDNSFLGSFATGASFTVPGAGGGDTFAASMNLTPGEHVNIEPALSQQAANDNGAINSMAQNMATQTSAITDAVSSSSGVIVGAIGNQTVLLENFWTDLMAKVANANAAVTSTAGTPSTAATSAAASTAATATSGFGAGTGFGSAGGGFGVASQQSGLPAIPQSGGQVNAGGFTTQQDPNAAKQSSSQQQSSQQQATQQQSGIEGLPYGMVAGTGVPIRGAGPIQGSTAQQQFPSRMQLGPDGKPIAPLINPDGTLAAPNERPVQMGSGVASPLDTAQWPFGPNGAPGNDNSAIKSVEDAVKQQTDAAKNVGDQQLDPLNKSADTLGQLQQQGQQIGQDTLSTIRSGDAQSLSSMIEGDRNLSQAVGSGASDIGTGLSSGFSSVVSAVSGLASAIAAAVSSAGGGSKASGGTSGGGSSGSGGSGSGGSGGGSGDGGNVAGQDLTPTNTDTGTFGGGGPGDAGTIDLGDLGGGTGGVTDAVGAVQDISSVVDAGNFATGGDFIVPGTGGTDSKIVKLRATPGERGIFIPPGMQVPTGVTVDRSGAAAAQAQLQPVVVKQSGDVYMSVSFSVTATDANSFLKTEDQVNAMIKRAVDKATKAA